MPLRTARTGETMSAVVGSVVDLTATLNPEYGEITPVSLPATEPATSQVIYTVASSHLPTWSPGAPYAFSIAPLVIVAGKNNGTGSRTLYWRTLKNGGAVGTGSFSVAAGYYWTITAMKWGVSDVGDTVEVRVWGSADLDYRWRGLVCLPTRIFPAPVNSVLFDLAIYTTYSYSIGESVGGNIALRLYFDQTSPWSWRFYFEFYSSLTTPGWFYCWKAHQTYGINRVWADEWPDDYYYTHASAYPRTLNLHWIKRIVFRRGPDI